jgi:hypothetical protein
VDCLQRAGLQPFAHQKERPTSSNCVENVIPVGVYAVMDDKRRDFIEEFRRK